LKSKKRAIFLQEILERKPYMNTIRAGAGAGAGARVSENILRRPKFFDDPKDINYFYFSFGTSLGSGSGSGSGSDSITYCYKTYNYRNLWYSMGSFTDYPFDDLNIAIFPAKLFYSESESESESDLDSALELDLEEEEEEEEVLRKQVKREKDDHEDLDPDSDLDSNSDSCSGSGSVGIVTRHFDDFEKLRTDFKNLKQQVIEIQNQEDVLVLVLASEINTRLDKGIVGNLKDCTTEIIDFAHQVSSFSHEISSIFQVLEEKKEQQLFEFRNSMMVEFEKLQTRINDDTWTCSCSCSCSCL
jgi:hypothetical protein